MFALLQKTSFMHLVQIVCGYFHALGVHNICSGFYKPMIYSWLKRETKWEMTCFFLFFAPQLNILFLVWAGMAG